MTVPSEKVPFDSKGPRDHKPMSQEIRFEESESTAPNPGDVKP
jgi:hypothetical protein